MQAEGLRRRTSSWVRRRVPAGIGSVQTFSGRHINVGPDGAIVSIDALGEHHAAFKTDRHQRALMPASC